MPIDTIIFDVEGTLMDCVPQVLDSWHLTLAEAGHTLLREQLQRYSGMDGGDMLEKLLPGIDHQDKEQLLKTQGERYRREFLRAGQPFPGIRDLMKSLKAGGYRLGIATTCKDDELKTYDDKMGVLEFTDGVACGNDTPKGKPHPDLFYAVIKKLNLNEPSRAMTIGDTPFDALGARPLGLVVTGVLSGGFSSDDLMSAGCALVLPQVKDLLHHLPAHC